jgi:hypothetical protein
VKTSIAFVLMVGGTLLMLGGFAWAVWAFSQLYSTALSDPMNGQIDKDKTSTQMLVGVGVGLVGFIPATVGSIMLGKGIIGRIVKKISGDATENPKVPTPTVRSTPKPKA